MIEETRHSSPTNEWDLLKQLLKVALVAGPGAFLYWQARQGDVVSLVIVGVVVSVGLMGLGAAAVMWILHKRASWESLRFQQNAAQDLELMRETTRLMSQQQLASARQNRSMGQALRNVDMLLDDVEEPGDVLALDDIEWQSG